MRRWEGTRLSRPRSGASSQVCSMKPAILACASHPVSGNQREAAADTTRHQEQEHAMSDDKKIMTAEGEKPSKCPVMHGMPSNATGAGRSNRDWWPNQVNLQILHQHSALSNPMGGDFKYAEEFKK